MSASSAAIEADDLLTEILHRLPIRSIIRFKLVSTHWLSLLSNPVFCSLVRNPKLNPAAGMFAHYKATGLELECSQRSGVDYISFSAKKQTSSPMKKKFKIVQSCNGLLLCNTGSEYLVYNPTTNMSLVLPKLNEDGGVIVNRLKISQISSMTLAFDPNISPYYKVICCTGFPGSMFIHIYSSDTRLWTKVPTKYKLRVTSRGVYWNGSIHWMHASSYFNIENQTLKRMPRPSDRYDWEGKYYLGESCDCLHYAKIIRRNGYGYSIKVFEMRRDYSSWDYKYHVDVPCLEKPFVENFYYNSLILSIVRGEKEEDSFLVLPRRFGVMRYNLVSKTSNKLHELLPGRVYTCMFQYIESLGCV